MTALWRDGTLECETEEDSPRISHTASEGGVDAYERRSVGLQDAGRAVVEEMCVSDGLIGLLRMGRRNQEEMSNGNMWLKDGGRRNDTPTQGTGTSLKYGYIHIEKWASDKKLPQVHERKVRFKRLRISRHPNRIYEKMSPNFSEVGANRRVANMKSRAKRVSAV
jgi:hypothetical protein